MYVTYVCMYVCMYVCIKTGVLLYCGGTGYHSLFWLRRYAVSRKAAGSNPNEIFVFLLNLPNPSSRTMDLKLTQPLTEMSTKNLPRSKARSARKTDIIAIC
jgi:hypothetical protein